MDLHRANVPLGSILRWNVDHSGYLVQPSGKGLRRTWKRRFYVLKGSRLFYFRSDHEDEQVEGVVDLDMYASVEPSSYPGKKKAKWGIMMTLKGSGPSSSSSSPAHPDGSPVMTTSSPTASSHSSTSPRMTPISPTPSSLPTSSGIAPFFARKFTSNDSILSSSPPSHSSSPSPLYLTPSSSGPHAAARLSPMSSPVPSVSEVISSPGTPVSAIEPAIGAWEAFADDEETRDHWVTLLRSRLLHFDGHILDTVLGQLDYGKYMRKRNPSNPSVPPAHPSSTTSGLTTGMRMGFTSSSSHGHSPTLSSSASTSSLTSLASQGSRRSTASSLSSSSFSSSSASSSTTTLTSSPSRRVGGSDSSQKSSPLTHNTPPSSPPLDAHGAPIYPSSFSSKGPYRTKASSISSSSLSPLSPEPTSSSSPKRWDGHVKRRTSSPSLSHVPSPRNVFSNLPSSPPSSPPNATICPPYPASSTLWMRAVGVSVSGASSSSPSPPPLPSKSIPSPTTTTVIKGFHEQASSPPPMQHGPATGMAVRSRASNHYSTTPPPPNPKFGCIIVPATPTGSTYRRSLEGKGSLDSLLHSHGSAIPSGGEEEDGMMGTRCLRTMPALSRMSLNEDKCVSPGSPAPTTTVEEFKAYLRKVRSELKMGYKK
ncbi:MAG: hypothetical protein DHS80DRAFT_28317 [Piptocephalis tieghemiana]|nr:MAG: hypothetical protein DHS80DRAFT_28317 [Piptocephalis tieghemiana]